MHGIDSIKECFDQRPILTPFVYGKLCFIFILFVKKSGVFFLPFYAASGCGRPLGMASGNIYDYQLSSSSDDAEGDVVDSMALSQRGRLFYPNPGWCSKQGDTEPWFLVGILGF